MKYLLVTFSLIMTQNVFATTSCLGEAQIIAKVGQIKERSMYDCVVKVDESSIVQFNMSYVCPLLLEEVLQEGVSVGLANGHDCALNTGDVLTGVIVRTKAGSLVLE